MICVVTLFGGQLWREFIDQQSLPTLSQLPDSCDSKEVKVVTEALCVEQLTDYLANGGRAIVICTPSEIQIAESIVIDDIKKAATEWLTETESLIDMFKSYRKMLTLLNLRHLGSQKPEDLAKLEDIGFSTPTPIQFDEPQSLHTLLSYQYIQQDDKLRKANQQLNALSLPFSSKSTSLNLTKILTEYNLTAHKNASKIDKLEVDSANLNTIIGNLKTNNADIVRELELQKESNDKLVKQFLNIQEEHEKKSSDEQKVRLELAALEKKLSQERQKLRIVERENLRLKHDFDGLLKRLFKIQEQYEKQGNEKQKHVKDLSHSRKQHEREVKNLIKQVNEKDSEIAVYNSKLVTANCQVNNISNSLTWRLTSPARKLSGLINPASTKRKQRQTDIALIATSELFDAEWYLETYADIKSSKINPAEHYLVHGAFEGRRPSQHFDGDWYLQRYPDVAESKLNPLLHFIKYGREEGRTCSPKLLKGN